MYPISDGADQLKYNSDYCYDMGINCYLLPEMCDWNVKDFDTD